MASTSGTRPVPDPGSLTAAEHLIWAGQSLDPEATLYNMAMAVEVDGAIDAGALQEALHRVVASDDVLRTVFPEVDGQPVRRTLEGVSVDLDEIDLPEAEVAEAEMWATLVARAARRLPLDRPLFDACLIRRGPERVVLFLNHHHIAMDAWSVAVLFRRWSEAYDRVLESADVGRDYPTFLDHVARERALRTSPRRGEAFDHWHREAGEAGSGTTFYGAPMPRVASGDPGSGRIAKVPVHFGPERTSVLDRLAQRPPFRGLTVEQSRYQVFATLLLAWVSRVSEREETEGGDPNAARVTAIGSPWHNRMTPDARESLGLFMELFPLRVRVEEDETFATLGAKVAAAMKANVPHVLPGASLHPAARDFAVVLNFITARIPEFAGFPTRARWIRPDFVDPHHAVRLHVHDFEGTGEPTLDLDLAEAVFDEVAQDRVGPHMLRLFDALADDLHQAIARVPLTDNSELEAHVVQGPRMEPAPPLMASFHAAVASTPDAWAVIDGDLRLTYTELGQRVSALAARLRRVGVALEDVVAVSLERSADQVVALLAVLESGGAFLPLDPDTPDDRLAFMMREAGVSVVVGSAGVIERVGEWGRGTVGIEPNASAGPDNAGHDEEPSPQSAGIDHLAYVLYTSGSTGRPKGVEVSHRSLAEYVHWARRAYGIDPGCRVPFFTSPAFDMTLTSIFVPLVSSGTVVVYRDEAGFEGLLVRRVFEDDDVDVVKLSPSHLALTHDLDLSQSRIDRLILGGENLRTGVAKAALDAFAGDVTIYNEYGPTEATVGCMIHRYDPDVDRGASVPIGKPADNVGIHLLDDDGAPVPRGVRGEIWISGPRVAKGYRGRPEETARAFRVGGDGEGERRYRTGDFARWGPRGTLEFLGRVDDQVKVRGVRIELAEVNDALSAHPEVRDHAAVVVRNAVPTGEACEWCGLQAAHPEAQLDVEGVCAPCRRFERDRERVREYFGDLDDLQSELRWAAENAEGPHDTLMLYSGGKDSTYALCRIVDMGAKPLVFMFDNGFISEEAKRNVRKVVDQLGVELLVGETPAMPEIFAESLERFSNVCDGCFKAIYTLAMNVAVERGIPAIVTGLSRGQIFETRLADLYRRGVFDPEEVDRTIHEARKVYHRMDDAVSRTMDVRIFEDDAALDTVRFVDFYRYCEVDLDELYDYLGERTPWIRPGDTGRSTNCLINEAGIFVHQAERGFHNYTLPYSWDVRLGHKERDAALAELDDELDATRIRPMLDAVGYRERPAPPPEPRLVAYYTAERDIPSAEWRTLLGDRLPTEMIPSRFVRLDVLPLTSHGKVDRAALEPPSDERPRLDIAYLAPRTAAEQVLAEVWADVLGLQPIGVLDDFFELGGDSMQCIQIVASARERDLVFAPRDVFANPTVEALARVIGTGAEAPTAAATANAAELAELEQEFGG